MTRRHYSLANYFSARVDAKHYDSHSEARGREVVHDEVKGSGFVNLGTKSDRAPCAAASTVRAAALCREALLPPVGAAICRKHCEVPETAASPLPDPGRTESSPMLVVLRVFPATANMLAEVGWIACSLTMMSKVDFGLAAS